MHITWVIGNVCYAKDEIVRGWHTTIPKGTKGTIQSIWQEVGTPVAFVDFDLPTGNKRVSVGFDEVEPQRSEVFLPFRTACSTVSGVERGAVVRIGDDGTESMIPAVRWPDGRIEIAEQKIEEPPPSSRDDVAEMLAHPDGDLRNIVRAILDALTNEQKCDLFALLHACREETIALLESELRSALGDPEVFPQHGAKS